MHGHDIEKLNHRLTYDEYQIGRALFEELKEAGHTSTKAAAICYRAGYTAAKRDARERKKKRLATLEAASDPVSLPEAIKFAKGDLTDE